MKFCEYHDDGTICQYCGNCGIALCREKANEPCNYCGFCEEGGIIYEI